MDVSKEEFRILVSISEGMDDLDKIEIYTEIDRNRIKEILEQLEKLFFVKVHRKGVHKINWKGELLEPSAELFQKHKDWLGQ